MVRFAHGNSNKCDLYKGIIIIKKFHWIEIDYSFPYLSYTNILNLVIELDFKQVENLLIHYYLIYEDYL